MSRIKATHPVPSSSIPQRTGPRHGESVLPGNASIGLLYFLFFCSGMSGLIYQVAWVREFGNVFGNTVYSASLVVAVFMLGLGVGSYLLGVWADRRYAARPNSMLRAYALAELVIALFGAAITMALPQLGALSAAVSSYSRDANGWYVLSMPSYALRVSIAIVLLTPATIVMGGTLTLLIRHLVRTDFEMGARRTALIYGVNTVGAALGCFMTDFVLVPAAGLRATQMVAVAMNLVAAAGALLLSRQASPGRRGQVVRPAPRGGRDKGRAPAGAKAAQPVAAAAASHVLEPAQTDSQPVRTATVLTLTSLALALTGFAAMGLEILWLRHFSLLLGQFQAVFSSVLGVVLLGIGLGAFVGGLLNQQTSRPAHWLMAAQAGIVASALLGLLRADVGAIHDAGRELEAVLVGRSPLASNLAELWFNLRPILAEVAVPALLMGFAFPLANALVQRTERTVGHHAGVLYLSNTVGSVIGSLVTGFGLLPMVGMQRSATILCLAAGLALVPLQLVSRAVTARPPERRRVISAPFAASALCVAVSLLVWLLLPPGYVVGRAQALPTGEGRLLAMTEGVNEIIAVTDAPPTGRALLTNGHPMAGTDPLGQRYMRALAHVPLLSLRQPQSVLVIGFGVGNTTHAATLHRGVRRVDVADLSKNVLTHARYFSDANQGVLKDARVSVYVNDGRQHLLMQPPDSYDLITLEPPPIAHAGVGALYSREFYALARTRLKPGGYLSQWLPVYQVPARATLAMIRAFVDVFPQAVLLSGAKADLLLLGTKDAPVEVDPEHLASALSGAPAVQEDLQRLALGSVREIVGTFIGSARSLIEATRETVPATDDHPIQEYSVRSLLNLGRSAATPSASLIDLSQIPTWCPRCFVDGKPVPLIEEIDTYLTLLDQFYTAPPSTAPAIPYGSRTVDGSAYLGAILPESSDVHNILGIAMMKRGRVERALSEFREALRLSPDSATAHWQLGKALASRREGEALDHLRRSVELDSTNHAARYDLATALFEEHQDDEALKHFQLALPSIPNAPVAYNGLGVGLVSRGRLAEGIAQFREAIRLAPSYVEAYNNLGTALAFQGKRDEAVEQFQHALTLQPDYVDARRNLTIVQRGVVPPGFNIGGGAGPSREQPARAPLTGR